MIKLFLLALARCDKTCFVVKLYPCRLLVCGLKGKGVGCCQLVKRQYSPNLIFFLVKTSEDAVHKYPTSRHLYTDWDQLAKEVQEEEKKENSEGDAALNALFKQIYADGSDEVKRAMNKSFQESGGTVLSTNWSEIKKETVEVKPPDCMEYKKYEY